MKNYAEFLSSKQQLWQTGGKEVSSQSISPILFPFELDLTVWAIRRGRCALFCDTGLGKTFMQLEWARGIGELTLIIAPLSVARQTIREAEKLGIAVQYVREQKLVFTDIAITNYEMIEHFDPKEFGAVVLDESSILKSLNGKTRQRLTDMFAATPYKLCCTATPAPNDIAEIANHAEFLGIMSRTDVLSRFFVHDDEGWRLRGHAKKAFFRWLSSWGMFLRLPSDLGYSDDGYKLPPLNVQRRIVESDYIPEGQLFAGKLAGITERVKARRGSVGRRILSAVELMHNSKEQWIVWCGLNSEAVELAKLIPDAVNVQGSDAMEKKKQAIEDFQDGKIRILISKSKIAGFGINLQNCHKQIFFGLNDSWEQFYQCVRRSWRFGQKKPVDVYVIISDAERAVLDNVLRKDKEADELRRKMMGAVKDYERLELKQVKKPEEYESEIETARHRDEYTLMLGDSCERMKEIEGDSVGLSIFSPPFLSLYAYSPTERDLGNSLDEAEFFEHFSFIISELLRVTKPGRNCCVHVSQVPAMLVRDGVIGLKDFRGKTIQQFEAAGWIYHGEVCIDKNPQAQAIRTHSKGLLFAQMRKDASWLRPALADYVLVFRKPGDNAVAIKPDLTNDEWIKWARPVWYDIDETDTLNYREARENDDDRHICPLQLGTIKRCIRLWSNPRDLVCSPFMGIGSEGFIAMKHDRRFVGIELKQSYFRCAARNISHALTERESGTLFSGGEHG